MDSYTKEEMRDRFMRHVLHIAKYWSEVEGQTDLEKCEGVVHSIFATIDGCTIPFPAMDIVLRPHPEDKDFYIENGEKWIEDGMAINDDTMLHEIMFNYKD